MNRRSALHKPSPSFVVSRPGADFADEAPGLWRWPFSEFSLFWRTFVLLAILLTGCVVAWLQTLRTIELDSRAMQTAQLLAAQVHLSRATMGAVELPYRAAVMQTMRDSVGLNLMERKSGDFMDTKSSDAINQRVLLQLASLLGPDTPVATQVNGQAGIWVNFSLGPQSYWLQTDAANFKPANGTPWLRWLLVTAALSLAGAAVITRLINRPLKELSFAASRMLDGHFSSSQLDEHVNTSEIREVNIGFNRMAQKLAKVEQERTLMLAGISHDLRTPLARLRLETELSVHDLDARALMVADISQLDAIIDKFLEYARPSRVNLATIDLRDLVNSCVFPLRGLPDIRVRLEIEPECGVHVDEVELARVFNNLLENARRYGKSVLTGVAEIHISAVVRDPWVLVKFRDHGIGVAPDQLVHLTQPFYRGETARTAANGAGLGLAIVEKTIARMGGTFSLAEANGGGLAAHIRLRKATRTAPPGASARA